MMTTLPDVNRIKRELEGDRFELLDIWKQYEAIAKHFNDLISRLRFQALAGVAGLSASLGLLDGSHLLGSGDATKGVGIAFVALATFWLALFVLDIFYYNRLLLGAVTEIKKIEDESHYSSTVSHLTLSTTVTQTVEAKPWDWSWHKSLVGPLLFYGIVFACLIVLAYVSWPG